MRPILGILVLGPLTIVTALAHAAPPQGRAPSRAPASTGAPTNELPHIPRPLASQAPPPRRPTPHGPPPMLPIDSSLFCPTSGKIIPLGPTSMKVSMYGMRGVAAGDASSAAELAFTYRGPSTTTVPFADGTVRRQIGLKLRAQDSCNVIYAMWYAPPNKGIGVSVKMNVGQSTHAQCVDHGYISLKPSTYPAPPPLQVGEQHVLRAELVGLDLTVLADGKPVWSGTLPPEAANIQGPAGIRSDNGEFDYELRVPGGSHAGATCAGVVVD